MTLPHEALPGLAARALELLGVDEAPEAYVALLRDHISSEPVSSHGAAVSVRRITERAHASTAAGADAERFGVLHSSLSDRGVSELDRFTLLLQRLSEERALTELLRATAAPPAEVAGLSCRDSDTDERSRGASWCPGGSSSVAPFSVASASITSSPRRAIAPNDAGWLFARKALCGRHLEPISSGEAGEEPSPLSALGSLPLDVQESSLVSDLLLVLCGFDGSRIRAQPARASATGGEAGGAGSGTAAVGLTGAPAVRFVLGADSDDAPTADPSLLGLALRMLPAADQYAELYAWSHGRCRLLSCGLVVHAFGAAVRECLTEHLIGIAGLQREHRASPLPLQQLFYHMQPATRALRQLHALLLSLLAPPPAAVAAAVGGGPSAAGVPHTARRGGGLLKLLHERRSGVGGDTEAAALLDFLLERSAAPFFGMLRAWLHRGVCDDPHGEFFIAEDARIRKEGLLTDFACAYWEKRFTLRPELVPAFIAPHAQAALDCGKLLHVVRECGREPANPRPDRLAYTLDERALGLAIGEARAWASQQALGVLVGEAQLLQRLQSVKHYFLLDQGDFFVHFLDSAEEELIKPVSAISVGRLASKLELSLRQAALTDPFKSSLSCELLPCNLTSQLLRIINTARAAPPPPAAADKTPGLDAFTFEYKVSWPLSLILSRNSIIKYQLLFRHLFHCKHVERQLSACWLSQQAVKALGSFPPLSPSHALRQRMLQFLHNIEHYMMLEVLEPNWHVLQLKMRVATSVDELMRLHAHFLDASLKECMLRDAVLLKLLAKLLTICVIYADQTRSLMRSVSAHLASHKLDPPPSARRPAQLAEVKRQVGELVAAKKYASNVDKFGAKFDDELQALLAELRKQALREWNLAHLLARLDYNNYWQLQQRRADEEAQPPPRAVPRPARDS